MKEVPSGWEYVSLGELFSIERGGSPRPIEEYITKDINGINWIKIGDTKGITKYIYETKEKIKPEGLYKSRKVYINDFILSNSMSFGHPYIMKTEGCIHDGWLVIRTPKDIIDINYLYYILSSSLVYQQFSQLAKGSTVKNLNIEAVQQVYINLSPLPEQHRIVAKIEELFSSLDKGIESLKTAQTQLKIYRQAVLKWAFEGKLTNDDVKEGELPEGWRWTRSSEVFEYITSGSRGWAKFYSDNGAIFIRMGNLDHDTILLDLSDIQYVKLPDKAEGTRSLVHSGDILISITADVGMIGLVPDKFPEAYINQHVALARPKSGIIHPTYLAWYLASKENGQKQLRELQRGATKVGLGLDDIRAVNIPICPIKEQSRIVAEIESRLSVCDKLEESITQSLLQSEALRQSILKKAFEGKLVPQDPNDEPASVLLTRIRAERESVVAKKTRTPTMPKPKKKRG